MIAGSETTSATLGYSTYVLATQPEIQDKLVEEIFRKNWNNNDAEDIYETATNLSYLDLFLREVLRMYYLTTTGVSRRCNRTTNVCGHIIEEGLFNINVTKFCNYLLMNFLFQTVSLHLMCIVFTTIQIYGDQNIQIFLFQNDMQLNVTLLLGWHLVLVQEIVLV